MTGLTFEPGSHRYLLDGEKVPSVTTIIGRGLPKPGLMWWAAREVAERAVADCAVLPARVEAEGTEAVVKDLKGTWRRTRDKAAERGTEIHRLAELLVHGEEVSVEPVLVPWVQHAADLIDELDIQPILTETMCASRGRWFAGTFDLIGTIAGDTWLLDWKSSKSVHGSYFLQLAAYANADFWQDTDGVEHELPHIDRHGIVHITPDGATLHESPNRDGAWDAFLAVKTVSDITKTIDSWEPKK